MKPNHVKAWKHALAHPDYRSRSDYTLEDASDSLIDHWLLHTGQWQVTVFGQEFQGSLKEVNYADRDCPLFTIEIIDPTDSDRPICIQVPFDRCAEVQ